MRSSALSQVWVFKLCYASNIVVTAGTWICVLTILTLTQFSTFTDTQEALPRYQRGISIVKTSTGRAKGDFSALSSTDCKVGKELSVICEIEWILLCYCSYQVGHETAVWYLIYQVVRDGSSVKSASSCRRSIQIPWQHSISKKYFFDIPGIPEARNFLRKQTLQLLTANECKHYYVIKSEAAMPFKAWTLHRSTAWHDM